MFKHCIRVNCTCEWDRKCRKGSQTTFYTHSRQLVYKHSRKTNAQTFFSPPFFPDLPSLFNWKQSLWAAWPSDELDAHKKWKKEEKIEETSIVRGWGASSGVRLLLRSLPTAPFRGAASRICVIRTVRFRYRQLWAPEMISVSRALGPLHRLCHCQVKQNSLSFSMRVLRFQNPHSRQALVEIIVETASTKASLIQMRSH